MTGSWNNLNLEGTGERESKYILGTNFFFYYVWQRKGQNVVNLRENTSPSVSVRCEIQGILVIRITITCGDKYRQLSLKFVV